MLDINYWRSTGGYCLRDCDPAESLDEDPDFSPSQIEMSSISSSTSSFQKELITGDWGTRSQKRLQDNLKQNVERGMAIFRDRSNSTGSEDTISNGEIYDLLKTNISDYRQQQSNQASVWKVLALVALVFALPLGYGWAQKNKVLELGCTHYLYSSSNSTIKG